MRGFVYVLATLAVSGMMVMGCEPADPGEEAEDFGAAIAPVWEAYQDTATALADDDEEAARDEAGELRDAVAGVESGVLEGEDAAFWEDHAGALAEALDEMIDADDIEGMREAFEPVSIETRELLARFHGDQLGPIYVLNCPMAFDNEGADWLQADEETRNPYFGDAMYTCGGVSETISAG